MKKSVDRNIYYLTKKEQQEFVDVYALFSLRDKYLQIGLKNIKDEQFVDNREDISKQEEKDVLTRLEELNKSLLKLRDSNSRIEDFLYSTVIL